MNVNPGATLQVQGGITLPNPFIIGGTGAANATGAVESVSGNNTLTGGINLHVGDAPISADAGSTLTVSTSPVQLALYTLTANVAGAATIASPIQGTGGLTKTGTGVLTLSGTNTYTGPTTVSAGTLLVNGSQPSSSVTVASGATLGGTGTTGPVTISGIVSPGVGGPGILHSGNATFNPGLDLRRGPQRHHGGQWVRSTLRRRDGDAVGADARGVRRVPLGDGQHVHDSPEYRGASAAPFSGCPRDPRSPAGGGPSASTTRPTP